MSKQDRQGVRTAPALEQKYRFNKQFTAQEKSLQRAEENMSREVAELTKSFMAALEGYVKTGDFDNFKTTLASELGTWEAGITARVTDTEGDIEIVQGDIQTMQGDIQTMQGDIQTAQGDIENVENDVAALTDLDSISSEGKSNGWYYRRWKNGTAECWKTLAISTAIATEWGALYSGTATTQSTYPITFAEKPVEIATLTAGSYQAILYPEKNGNGVNTTTKSASYNLCRPSAITTASTYYINLYVIGKWK